MIDVLFKALSFIIVIAVAYITKKKGVFSPTDYKIVTKIAINITLPMAILTSFASFDKDPSLLILAAIGFILSIFMWFLGFLFSLKKDYNEKVHYMLNMPCFNIGSFTMPFVQGFLGSYGVIATCMYDIGNAIVSSGVSYALTSSVLNPNVNRRDQIKNIGKKLMSSVPFVTYTLMLVIAILGFTIPKHIITISSTIASANGFMAMFMLGLMLDLNIERKYIKKIIQTLIIRYLIYSCFALVFYFLTPFPLIIRQILVLIMFSPTSALVPAFTEMCNGDRLSASFSSSLSIIVSVIIITILIAIFNL